ncbi:hypothetical protein BDZ45DRAFT_447153 [Acephala macrosclerotiorum]|nr:hypothetical protein BDZ45DRAFT_447153 [Acephala macrosclerotiorum]
MVSGHILVAGAVTNDWLTFQQVDSRDLSRDPWRDRTTGVVVRKGGVGLISELLRHGLRHGQQQVFGPSTDSLNQAPSSELVHAILDMIPALEENQEGSTTTFRVERLRRIANQQSYWHSLAIAPSGLPDLSVLLFVDSSNGFIDTHNGMELLQLTRPQHLVYKMARPLGMGHLWDEVRLGPRGDDGERDPSRVVVVVNADDLRAEGIELSRHLSWEKAAEDFVRQLGSNGRLDTLVTCANLIVRFDCDGVIHHRGRDQLPPILYFDPERAEGEFVESHLGQMIGLTTAFTAGLGLSLLKDPDDIEKAIRLAFATSRRLAETGFRQNFEDEAPDYAFAEIMRDLQPDKRLASVERPSTKICASMGPAWTILEETMGEAAEIARHIVQLGPSAALARVPRATFGSLITADRQEIESFRAITNLLKEYFRSPQTKPWCIGIFGPHGSGKAFAATQVAERAANGRPFVRLEYNLSQFTDTSTLFAAFQTIRDQTLAGKLPMVFFDTFDAALDMKLGWLRYFLNPMQRGKFLDQGKEHPLGTAVLFFVASSYSTFAQFAEPIDSTPDDPDREAFYNAKGPDFISCLRGYIDILGSDCYDSSEDRMYPIRRALLLRALLERREPQLKVGERIIIDDSVLNGLLTIPRYHHGARSLEMILAMSTVSGRKEFERAALPTESQLNLHVDAKEFMNLVRFPRLSEKLRGTIARELDVVYKQQRESMAVTAEERRKREEDPAMLHWDDMKEQQKESMRSQADDIPHKLRMVNCYMAKEVRGTQLMVSSFNDAELDILAEREHARRNAERLQRQWRLGSRGKPSYLMPWRDLDQRWKDVNRAMVECIPRVLMLPAVAYHIYRLGTGAS